MRNIEIHAPLGEYVLYGQVGSLVSYCTMYLLAARIVLIYPDVAVDGRSTLSRAGRIGGPARKGIVAAMVRIWLPAALLGHILGAMSMFVWPDSIWASSLISLTSFLVSVYTSMASMCAAGLIYKRLKPEFDKPETEYERTIREIKETPLVSR
jgi:hypothetical protein